MRYPVFLLAIALFSTAPVVSRAQEPGEAAATTVVVNRRPPPLGFVYKITGEYGAPYPYPEITTVVTGSNAARAGLMAGDTLVSVNGHDLREPAPLFPDRTPGARYVLRIRRGGEDLELIYNYPAPIPAASPQGSQHRRR